MRVYLRDESAQTILRAATLRQKLQIKLSISPSHSILTPGRPVPALTLLRQAPGRVATGVPIFKSLVWLDSGKIPTQAGFEPGIFRSLEADALPLGQRGGCAPQTGSRIPQQWKRIFILLKGNILALVCGLSVCSFFICLFFIVGLFVCLFVCLFWVEFFLILCLLARL